MGVTNIHRAEQLIAQAGSDFEDQAFVEPFHEPVYIILLAPNQ